MSTLDGLRVRACQYLPRGVCVLGTQIMINVCEMSPQWVNDLARTKAGTRLLRRIIGGRLRKDADDVREAIAEAGQDDKLSDNP